MAEVREGHLASQTWVAGERVASWALRKGLGALGAWTALSDRRVLCGAFPIVSALFLPSVPPNTASSARSPLPPSRSQRPRGPGTGNSAVTCNVQRSDHHAVYGIPCTFVHTTTQVCATSILAGETARPRTRQTRALAPRGLDSTGTALSAKCTET